MYLLQKTILKSLVIDKQKYSETKVSELVRELRQTPTPSPLYIKANLIKYTNTKAG